MDDCGDWRSYFNKSNDNSTSRNDVYAFPSPPRVNSVPQYDTNFNPWASATSDDQVDLFVLEDQPYIPTPTGVSAFTDSSSDTKTKPGHKVIPYVPKLLARNTPQQSTSVCEYTPSQNDRTNKQLAYETKFDADGTVSKYQSNIGVATTTTTTTTTTTKHDNQNNELSKNTSMSVPFDTKTVSPSVVPTISNKSTVTSSKTLTPTTTISESLITNSKAPIISKLKTSSFSSSSSIEIDEYGIGKKCRIAHTPTYNPSLVKKLPNKTRRSQPKLEMIERARRYEEQLKLSKNDSITVNSPVNWKNGGGIVRQSLVKRVKSEDGSSIVVNSNTAKSTQLIEPTSTKTHKGASVLNTVHSSSAASCSATTSKVTASSNASTLRTISSSSLAIDNTRLHSSKLNYSSSSVKTTTSIKTTRSVSVSGTKNNEQGIVVKTPQTHDKTKPRVAHEPNPNRLPNLYPIQISKSKISLLKRKNIVLKFHKELTASQSPKGSKNQAKLDCLEKQARELERDLCIRSRNNLSIYFSLCSSKVAQIRKNTNNKPNVQVAPSKSTPALEAKKAKISKGMVPKIEMKKVSHEAILNAGASNFSILKRARPTLETLTLPQKLLLLKRLAIPEDELKTYGFPYWDGKEPGFAIFPNYNKEVNEYIPGMRVTCCRCGKLYLSPQSDASEDSSPRCVYHQGRIFQTRMANREFEQQYICCQGDSQSVGCQSHVYHVTDGYEFTKTHQGFVNTESKPYNLPEIVAIDCEMCFTETGFELSRVTVLNFDGDVIYDQLVKPKGAVLDYNTKFSGIKQGDLDNVTTTLNDVQRDLLDLISIESVIIGHGLDSDFRVLKLFHPLVVDTTYLYPHKKGLPYKRSLKTLAAMFLSKIIQDNVEGGHDSHEDAKTALELVKLKVRDKMKHVDFD